MPKVCAIPQLVSAPLNPIPIAEHFRRSHPQCEHSYLTRHISKEEAFLLDPASVLSQVFATVSDKEYKHSPPPLGR